MKKFLFLEYFQPKLQCWGETAGGIWGWEKTFFFSFGACPELWGLGTVAISRKFLFGKDGWSPDTSITRLAVSSFTHLPIPSLVKWFPAAHLTAAHLPLDQPCASGSGHRYAQLADSCLSWLEECKKCAGFQGSEAKIWMCLLHILVVLLIDSLTHSFGELCRRQIAQNGNRRNRSCQDSHTCNYLQVSSVLSDCWF